MGLAFGSSDPFHFLLVRVERTHLGHLVVQGLAIPSRDFDSENSSRSAILSHVIQVRDSAFTVRRDQVGRR